MNALELLLTAAQREAFVGALLAVCRADGEVTPTEVAALAAIARDVNPGVAIDPELLLTMPEVGPAELAAAVAHTDLGAFRSTATSSPHEITRAFLMAAHHVAEVDDVINDDEHALLRRFAHALRHLEPF